MTISLSAVPANELSSSALDALASQVRAQLNGRVHDFRVEMQDGGLVLSGRTRTYYAKQLAQHYVMELASLVIVANRIEVI